MDEGFELIIDVQAKGIHATEQDIRDAQAALDSLNREGKVTEQVVQHVTAALKKQGDKLKTGKAQWQAFTDSVQDARKAQQDLAKAQAAVSAAKTNRKWEQEAASLTRLERAQRQMAKAQQELNRANGAVGGTANSSPEKRTAALQRQAQAIRAATAAEKELAAARRQSDQMAARLNESRTRLGDAIQDQQIKSQVSGLNQQAQAHARLEVATQRRARAEADLRKATATGDIQARIRATDQLTRAIQKQTAAQQTGLENINATRYANYDLANTLLRTGAVLGAVGIGSVVVGAQFERSFANVERTLRPGEYAVEDLREELMQLTREIPRSFEEISTIATLGNQLGVAGKDITAFTKTVAQFSTITGMSIEETALAFGQLGNLLGVLPQDYDRLASAIALVGVNSAATETQIVSIAREIAPAARAAGLTAEQVIGLSGALGSIKVPPERSRSTILQFFETLNTAAASGGQRLDDFASVIGVTSDELKNMVIAGQGEEVLRRFIGTLGDADTNTIEVTQALQRLGLAGLRTNPTMRALSDNIGLLNTAFSDSKQGWTENTELQRQYEIILDTLASKWTLFVNGLMEFIAVVGSSVGPGLAQIIDLGTDVLNVLSDFAQTGFGQFLSQVAQVLILTVSAWALLRGGIALATGSALAFKTATNFLAGAGMRNAILGMASALGTYTPAANGAARGTWNLRAALIGLGKATVVVGLIQLLFMALTDMKSVGDFVIDALVGIGQAVVWVGKVIADFLGGLPGGGIFKDWAVGLQGALDSMEKFKGSAHKEWGNFARDMGWLKDETEGVSDAAGNLDPEWNGAFDPEIPNDFNDGLNNVAETVRTLKDYATDLASVWNRAFEIQFGPQQALDAIATQWADLAKAARESELAVRGYKVEIGGLKTDKASLQYWLSVAEMYGDEKRAAEIRADLNEVNQKLIETEAKLKAEQEKQSTSLTGNSNAAIQNRAAIAGIVQANLAYLEALAASGASQATLKAESERLRAELYTQGEALGYSRSDLDLYADAFDAVTVAVNNVPKNVTVAFNADPAIQAMNEFVAKAEAAANRVQGAWSTVGSSIGNSLATGMSLSERQAAYAATQLGSAIGINLGTGIKSSFTQTTSSNRFADPGIPGYKHPGNIAIDFGNWLGSIFGWADGGYTGRGGKYEPAGIVHKGEYVLKKEFVNQATGLPYADALGRLQRGAPGRQGYAGGGFVSSSAAAMANVIASFGPMAEMQMRQAFQAILNVDGQALAHATSRANARGTTLGES